MFSRIYQRKRLLFGTFSFLAVLWFISSRTAHAQVEEQLRDNFPSASINLPSIPPWNAPSGNTLVVPLLIGFTRNWQILQQAVVSYITAGWPAEHIYIIENTGLFDDNKSGKLSLQDTLYLNHSRLHQLGVQVIRTPTLLNFAQLQNYYIHIALEHKWTCYFWSHMDVIALTDETQEQSLYTRARDVYTEWLSKSSEKWAAIWFAYDRLALVNTEASVALGGWDVFINYYLSDCDMYSRMRLKGYQIHDRKIGHVFDVGKSLPDLQVLYRQGSQRNDGTYKQFVKECMSMQQEKNNDKRGRNFWQGEQHRKGLEQAILLSTEHGKHIYREKWGTEACDLGGAGIGMEHAWNTKQHR